MTGLHGLNKYNQGVARGSGTFQRFQWVLPGKLARSTQPNYGAGDSEHTLTQDDVQWLRDNKIACLVSANHCKMKKEGKDLLGKAGIAFFHFKVEDFQPPKKEQLEKAASVIELFGRRGATLVYCGYGQGRTGTFVAGWAMQRYLKGRNVNLDPLCTKAALTDNFGVENIEQANAVRAAVRLPPVTAAAGSLPPMGMSPSGIPLPMGMSPPGNLPMPSSGGAKPFNFSSADTWQPQKISGAFNPAALANFSSGSTWAAPPVPALPENLGSGSGPVEAGFPDEDNLTVVSLSSSTISF